MSEENTLGETISETLHLLARKYNDAVKSNKDVSEALNNARAMVPVIKQYYQEMTLKYKAQELKQREKEFEYKSNVLDPQENQIKAAQLALQSQYLDLVRQGKSVLKNNGLQIPSLPSIKSTEEDTPIITGVEIKNYDK